MLWRDRKFGRWVVATIFFEGHGPTLLINENLSLFVLLAALPQVNLLSIDKNDALRPLSQTKLYCTL